MQTSKRSAPSWPATSAAAPDTCRSPIRWVHTLTTNELSFSAPTTIEAAVADLADEGSMALGGGTSVAILLKNGLIDAERLVYLGRIPELSGVTTRGDGAI